MKLRKNSRVLNPAIALLLLITGLLTSACPMDEEPIEPPEPIILIPVYADTSVEAEFEIDGHWQASGFVARVGDLLMFEPQGNAKYLAHKALQLHIGRTPVQLVHSSGPQRITRAGEIYFRSMPEDMGPYPEKTIRIKISNSAKENEQP